MSPVEIDWQVMSGSETEALGVLRDQNGEPWYEEQKQALREFFCNYVNAQPQCRGSIPNSVSPMGATKQGGKIIKMRWAYPGSGKRGGLRLVLVAFCAEARVAIAGAWFRRDDPTDGDVQRAADLAV